MLIYDAHNCRYGKEDFISTFSLDILQTNKLIMTLSVVQSVVIIVIFIVVQVTITKSAACLSQFYDFDARDSSLPKTNDARSPEILLDPPFLLFGKSYNVCHVQSNGIISLGEHAPKVYNGTLFFPYLHSVLIAPFYGDVSTQIRGNIWYKTVYNRSAELENIKEDINDAFSNESEIFSPKYALIATWYRVGYSQATTNKVNTFQCVITTDGVKSFAIFLYNIMQWVLEYDPVYPARVGFVDGASNVYNVYEFPNSGQPGILHYIRKSNVRRQGIWMFRIDGKIILSPQPITFGVNCSTPTNPVSGTIEPYNCTQAGAVIQFHCNKTYAPTEWRTAVCQLNGTWTPDPAQHICTHKGYNDSKWIDGKNIYFLCPITEGVNCSTPTNPVSGTIEPYNCTQAGAVIQFHCNKTYTPTEWRTAVCQLNGTWTPDPAQHICTHKGYNDSKWIDGNNIYFPCPITEGVNCSTPTNPVSGTIEPYNCTQAGAVIQFHCNKTYAPTEWRTAECQLNGSWTPDPAQLICTRKRRSYALQPFIKYSVISAGLVVFILGLGAGIVYIITRYRSMYMQVKVYYTR